jgi:hypothetical protein
MEEAFYKERLSSRHGLEVLIPHKSDRQIVHQVIYEELVCGKTLPASRDEYKRIIGLLMAAGAEAIILGCTEISRTATPRFHYLIQQRSMHLPQLNMPYKQKGSRLVQPNKSSNATLALCDTVWYALNDCDGLCRLGGAITLCYAAQKSSCGGNRSA